MSIKVLTVSIIYPDRRQEEVQASWEAVKKALDNAHLEPIWLEDGACLLVDEEGLLKGLPFNPLASQSIGFSSLCGPVALVRKHLVKKVLGE